MCVCVCVCVKCASIHPAKEMLKVCVRGMCLYFYKSEYLYFVSDLVFDGNAVTVIYARMYFDIETTNNN